MIGGVSVDGSSGIVKEIGGGNVIRAFKFPIIAPIGINGLFSRNTGDCGTCAGICPNSFPVLGNPTVFIVIFEGIPADAVIDSLYRIDVTVGFRTVVMGKRYVGSVVPLNGQELVIGIAEAVHVPGGIGDACQYLCRVVGKGCNGDSALILVNRFSGGMPGTGTFILKNRDSEAPGTRRGARPSGTEPLRRDGILLFPPQGRLVALRSASADNLQQDKSSPVSSIGRDR